MSAYINRYFLLMAVFLLWANAHFDWLALRAHSGQRVLLLAGVLTRFFLVAWISVGLLALTGATMLGSVCMTNAPAGWHPMMGIGLLMFAIFGHLYFGPFSRMKKAVAQADWPQAGKQVARIHPLVVLNFALGWLAIAAVLFLH